MLKIKHLLFLAFPVLLINSKLFAQSGGKIAGKIIDQKTSETLIGATVGLQGSTKGAATNVDGRYVLTDLQPGTYVVVVKYIGYQTKSISDIVVKAGAVTNLDIVMSEATTTALKEVVVKATYRQASVASLYAIQKNSVVISDGISSELIKKSPDRSTSDVLKRVSGTTIQDNKFVVVRGLSDRYNTASLDGTPLPSTEPNRKAFSFDIVPANLIENIIISKTATPDLSADFAGGNIQILTKDIPDQNFINLGAGYSYNSQSTFKNFQSGYRNTSDYFGFDGGARTLVDNFPTTAQIIGPPRLTPKQNLQSIQSLNNDFTVYNKNAFLGQSYQFTLGNVQEIGKNKNRFGTTIALTYRNAETTIPDLVRQYNNFNFKENQYKFSTNIGALANFAYSFGNNKITFKNLYNRVFDDIFTFRTGSNNSNGSYDSRFYAYDLTQKSLLKSTIDGDHKIGAGNAKLDWSLGYSNIKNDQPDQRKVNYLQSGPNEPFVASITNLGKENARFFSKLNENIYSGKVDFKLPVKMFGQTSNFKAGISSQYRKRDFNARFLGIILKDGTSDIRLRPIETLFGPNAVNSGAFELDEISAPNDNYNAHSYTNAGYIMLDNKISEKFRAVYGVRVERFDLKLNTLDPDQQQPRAELNNTDFLPSVNLTYSLTAKANLRASYYRTVARPEFRELAPFSYYDYELLATQIGNPLLKRTMIDNADLRYEFYPSAGQIFSVSAFYKKFANAIEPSIDDVNSSTTISYFNSKSAYVYGAELEARKSLDFINDAGFFKNSTIYANLALTKSKIQNDDNPQLLEHDRPLVGQSPYVINAGFQHNAFDNKLSVNILYNRLGKRIFYAGGVNFPSVYEAPRDVLDFQLGYKVLKGKGEIKVNGTDLLNQNDTFYYDKDKNPAGGTGNTFKRFTPGSAYSLTFNYNF
ncbi:TonB-dependent receptor [Mucilaginibacter sabulilitoris]|uniref:TonB-dependent receptor n=1 Tax=Mucilaginibacter sabulilitoris TaxID=1173583 RepID=A0ABZ0TI04_9SPHI|nr:TonB-dependent receptor [Mucilaginibacter sabulilitoris]WPU92032.1 TonB-dependent receptor [Mucilaginibacter sabulilitoris]